MSDARDLDFFLAHNRSFFSHGKPADLMLCFRLRVGRKGDPQALRRELKEQRFSVQVHEIKGWFRSASAVVTADIGLSNVSLSMMDSMTRLVDQCAQAHGAWIEDLSYSTADNSQYHEYQ